MDRFKGQKKMPKNSLGYTLQIRGVQKWTAGGKTKQVASQACRQVGLPMCWKADAKLRLPSKVSGESNQREMC